MEFRAKEMECVVKEMNGETQEMKCITKEMKCVAKEMNSETQEMKVN